VQYSDNMRTISITIDDPLLTQVDRLAKASRLTRSELLRLAVKEWLAAGRRRQLAQQDRAGYERVPVRPGEFDALLAAQPLVQADEDDR